MIQPRTIGELRECIAMFPDDTQLECMLRYPESGTEEDVDWEIDVQEQGDTPVVQFITIYNED